MKTKKKQDKIKKDQSISQINPLKITVSCNVRKLDNKFLSPKLTIKETDSGKLINFEQSN